MYRNILLIDDDPDDIELLKEAIDSIDAQNTYQIAYNRMQALELLHNIEIVPDLIVLDLHIPGVMGTEILTHIKTSVRTSQIPVALYSSHSKEVMQQMAGQFEPLYYIQKPNSYKDLIVALKDILC
jgi:CheY-like chemotaxis protein